MTLGTMASEQHEQQDVSGRIKRFESASRKFKNRGLEDQNKLKDANDNYTVEPDMRMEGKRVMLVKSRLCSIDEEKGPEVRDRSPNEIEPNKNTLSVSNENLNIVGSPELRRKLSSHFLRKSSAPSILGTSPDRGAIVKVGEVKEKKEEFSNDIPHVFVFPNTAQEKVKEAKEAHDGEKDEAEEETDGGQVARKDEGKKTRTFVKRVTSMRFPSRRGKKKVQDIDESIGRNEELVSEDYKQGEDRDKSQVSIILSKSPNESTSNKEIMRELSSFKFKGMKHNDEQSLTKTKPDKVSQATSLDHRSPKQDHAGRDASTKGFAALKSNRHRNPRTSLPTPPAKPPSQQQPRQGTNSIHEYDLIGFDDSPAPGSPRLTDDNELKEEPAKPAEEVRVYATLCPSDEEDVEGSSDVDPPNPEDTGFNNIPLPPNCPLLPGVFVDHVYEDIDKVMPKVMKPQVKKPSEIIGAYQVSDLTHSGRETVAPVVYDEPQSPVERNGNLAKTSFDLSALFTPSRDNSWNSTGDGVVKNPGARSTWATRIPSESSTTPSSYDVPQAAPRGGSQKSLLGSGQGGSTPHSPTTLVPPLEHQNVPPGWRVEPTVTKDPVFINEATSEKWYKATPPDGGEPYYYSEDRLQTRWELPQVTSPSARHRMRSEGGSQPDDPKPPSHQLRQGRIPTVRPHSFHPNLRSSSPSLPIESRFIDNPPSPVSNKDWDYEKKKEEIKRRFSYRSSNIYSDGHQMHDMAFREKEGPLTIMLMKDRARSKKGRPGYAVLAGSHLKYFKDHKHFERDSSSPELSLQLWRTDVCWTRTKPPAKRTVFELTIDQEIYLVQGEDEQTSSSWFEAIRGAVAGGAGFPSLSPDEDDIHSPSANSPSNTLFPQSGGHGIKKGNSKIRERLKNFIFTRPDKEDLRRKGILQEENVFGKDIRKLCERERTTVPHFVHQCIKYIDKRGLECDGIYRVSGNLSLIQKLRFQVDQEKPVDLESSPWKEDIHVITGALKLYFRELPEPLFTFKTFDKFIASITHIPDVDRRILAFRSLFEEMPRVNQDTIFTLFSHLKRVMDNVQHNRMPAKNLATVFGPTLMWPERESMNISMATVYQNQVMEFVLLEFDNIFRS